MVWSKVSEWADRWQTLRDNGEQGKLEEKRAPVGKGSLLRWECSNGVYFELSRVYAILNAHVDRTEMMRFACPH